MSQVTNALKELGVPAELLNYAQSIINKYLALLVVKVPSTTDIITSIRGQLVFKQIYRQLSPTEQAGVDKILPTAVLAMRIKVLKSLGLS